MANPIIAEIRNDDLAGDPWGTTMGWAFGCCETLHALGEDVPFEAEFVPSPLHHAGDFSHLAEVYPDSLIVESVTGGYWSVSDVQRATRILVRYANVLRAAGLDY